MAFLHSLLALTLLIALASPASAEARGSAPLSKSTMVRDGFLSVAEHGAVPNDDVDDTAALQAAFDAARDAGLVAFLPSGRYLVSDTLSLMQRVTWDERGGKWRNNRRQANVVVGSTTGSPPVIELADNAPGFDDPTNPKPVIWIWAQRRTADRGGSKAPKDEQPNISFNQVFRGIDLDLKGPKLKGAVGIRHAGSQGSTLEDVTVLAEGAFSGVYNMPGQGGGVYDLTVIGGRYGIWADHKARYPMLAGLVLKQQTKAAIYWKGQSNMTIVGFHIERTAPGYAVDLRPGKKAYNRALTMVDGVIQGQSEAAIDNRAERNLYLKNVFVSGYQRLVNGEAARPQGNATGHIRVDEYAHTGPGTQALVDGEKTKADYETSNMQWVPEIPEPGPLLARHLWDKAAPSFEDSDAKNVRVYGAVPDDGRDDTDAFKTALAKHSKLFVPKGTFLIRDTLTLKADTQMFGAAKHLTIIRAVEGWKAAPGTPILTTVDDSNAETILSSLLIERPANNSNLTLLEWRAGRHSVVHGVMGGKYGPYQGPSSAASGGSTFAIKGKGGGRWFGLAAEWNSLSPSSKGANYRHLRVEATRQPLAMYAVNVERGLSDPQAEISNSSDVSIYYLKGETLNTGSRGCAVLEIKGSRNIGIYGYSGIADPRGNAVLRVIDSDGVTLANIMPVRSKDGYDTLRVSKGNSSVSVNGRYPVSLAKTSP